MLRQSDIAGGGFRMKWQRVTSGLTHGGYAAWEAAVAEVEGTGPRDHLPVFLRLVQPAGVTMTQADAITATLALPGVLFSRHERDLLATAREEALAAGWTIDVRAVAFCPRAMLSALPAFWRVLQIGPAIAVPVIPDGAAGTDLRTTTGDLDRKVPLIALIDDGIGFLNTRFRKNRHATRFKAVWLQAAERVEAEGPAPRRDVVAGRVLTEAEINAHLAAGGDEAEIYRQVNTALHCRTDSPLTNRRVAHGTHVLDLAAGSAPWAAEAMARVPLLAVQLPPATVRETSGRRMEAYLVQGLRWILAETLRLSNRTDVPPLVINLSIGSLAGPGDKSAFLAEWFAHEIERHARQTGGGEVRLVIAYGNARESRLVARGELRRSQPITLQWRVQPDDHTSSFLELRVDAKMMRGLKLVLTPPKASGMPVLEVDWPAGGSGWRLLAPTVGGQTAGGPVAAVTSLIEAEGQALLHLALAPTVTVGPLQPCPAGTWGVEVRTAEAEPVRLIARVQRDDTPPGYRTLGRQSWLDHPQGWDWDEEQRSYTAPRPLADAPGCPVTREGSCVAFAGIQDHRILFVGAVRPDGRTPYGVKPMRYSSVGVRLLARPGESAGPTLVAQGDDGTALPGRLATGVLSGSVTRISGTSMAAPAVARALVRYFLTMPEADRNPMAERRALSGRDDWTVPDPRLGHGALIA